MLNKKLSSLSILFPCYNDAGTIGNLVSLATQVGERLSDDYEVIVVDDMSTDKSRAILDELCSRFPVLRVICHGRNRGYGGALKTGFAAAIKDYLFYTDGDGQYDVQELERLAEAMRDGVDMVSGYKVNRADNWFRRLTGFCYNRLVRFAFGIRVRDVDCAFRLMRRSVFERVKLESDTGLICTELMKKVQDRGLKTVELPVHHFPRLHGSSQFFTVSNVGRSLLALLGYWWKTYRAGEFRSISPDADGVVDDQ